ncbi:MAG: type II toxin-antitoxin system VapC family toxin [Acidimicrobiia bacterium]
MTLLFDSTVLIAHLRGVPGATNLLRESVGSCTAAASVLSRVEIEGGMRSGERADVSRLFSALRLEPVSDAIAVRAGSMLRQYRSSHAGIDIVDYVIAATAEELGAELMTLNVRHFPMFETLQSAF